MRRSVLLLPFLFLLTLSACDFSALTKKIDEKIFGKPPTPPPAAVPVPLPPGPVTPPPPPTTQAATLPAETVPGTQPATQPSSQPATVMPGATANIASVPDDVIIDELNGYIEC